MPSNLFGEDETSSNGILRQIVIGLTIAAILGSWAYASTRASSEELDEVELELKAVDLELKNDLKDLTGNIHEIDVEQSAFRAQVREALRIPEPSRDNR